MDAPSTEHAVALYLDLLKKTLTRSAFPEHYRPLNPRARSRGIAANGLRALVRPFGLELVRKIDVDPEVRAAGRDWPPEAETMIGLRRLDNIQLCIEWVIGDGVPGDLIETGVWRGGAAIFMRGVLKAYGVDDRAVWLADSFAGLPPPDPAYPVDKGDEHHQRVELSVSIEEVRWNFERYGLLDDQVRFLVGWFEDTLPEAPINEIAVLRLDGDMYGSTITALQALYPRLQPGGFAIVDDYRLPGARQAVEDYRSHMRIDEPVVDIDGEGVFWRRS
jgi:O-methyltransferase